MGFFSEEGQSGDSVGENGLSVQSSELSIDRGSTDSSGEGATEGRTRGKKGGRALTWTSQWESMEVDALSLGISSIDFWELPPRVTIDLCNRKIEELKSNAQQEIDKAWLTAYYTAVGFNDPKKFPKKPHKVKAEEKKEQSVDEQADALLRLKGIDRVVKKSTESE